MAILFLDDDAKRHSKARDQLFVGKDVVYVWNYEQAVAALDARAEPFDEAHLDHDLIELTGCVEKTGLDVARYIAKMPAERRPRRVIIHSHNAVGAFLMEGTLVAVGCPTRLRPFK